VDDQPDKAMSQPTPTGRGKFGIGVPGSADVLGVRDGYGHGASLVSRTSIRVWSPTDSPVARELRGGSKRSMVPRRV